jgi:hypothetical protein
MNKNTSSKGAAIAAAKLTNNAISIVRPAAAVQQAEVKKLEVEPQPGRKEFSIDARLARIDELANLKLKREKLTNRKNQLKNFKASADGSTAVLSFRDNDGNKFDASTPEFLEAVQQMMLTKIDAAISEIDTEVAKGF